MQNVRYVPLGYEQLDNLSDAVSLTVPDGATVALLSVGNTSVIRWRDDGVAPTATTGMIINPDINVVGGYEYWGSLADIQFIDAGTGATLDVSYYRIAG